MDCLHLGGLSLCCDVHGPLFTLTLGSVSSCAATAEAHAAGKDNFHSSLKEERKKTEHQRQKSIKMRATHHEQEKQGQWLHTKVGEKSRKRTQTEGEYSEGENGGEKESKETIIRVGRHSWAERDNQRSCSCCWSQTGSPDNTSVGLTQRDALISLLKSCVEQQTTQRRETTCVTVGLHDVSGVY